MGKDAVIAPADKEGVQPYTSTPRAQDQDAAPMDLREPLVDPNSYTTSLAFAAAEVDGVAQPASASVDWSRM
ncbi:MAG: hypothetical protein WAS54_01635 [Scrofimicrobium sp.]